MTCNCNKNPIKLGVKRLYKDVQLPQYTHVGDACFDIRVYIEDSESFSKMGFTKKEFDSENEELVDVEEEEDTDADDDSDFYDDMPEDNFEE